MTFNKASLLKHSQNGRDREIKRQNAGMKSSHMLSEQVLKGKENRKEEEVVVQRCHCTSLHGN
jgi:hypothetical protein